MTKSVEWQAQELEAIPGVPSQRRSISPPCTPTVQRFPPCRSRARGKGVTTHTRVPGEDPPPPGTATVQPLLGTHHEPPGAKGQECIWCNKRTEAMGASRCAGSTAGTRGPELFETGMERNNKAVNHDTKHAFILFTKTAWIAKTLQTAFQFNDVESWRDGDLNRREISLFITASAQVLQYYFYFDFNFSKFTKITSRSKPLQLGFFSVCSISCSILIN